MKQTKQWSDRLYTTYVCKYGDVLRLTSANVSDVDSIVDGLITALCDRQQSQYKSIQVQCPCGKGGVVPRNPPLQKIHLACRRNFFLPETFHHKNSTFEAKMPHFEEMWRQNWTFVKPRRHLSKICSCRLSENCDLCLRPTFRYPTSPLHDTVCWLAIYHKKFSSVRPVHMYAAIRLPSCRGSYSLYTRSYGTKPSVQRAKPPNAREPAGRQAPLSKIFVIFSGHFWRPLTLIFDLFS